MVCGRRAAGAGQFFVKSGLAAEQTAGRFAYGLIIKNLIMKTALVTGANKGIGLETARILAQNGYAVYIGCRNPENGLAAAAQLKADGLSNVESIQLDVTDQASVDAARGGDRGKVGRAGCAGEQCRYLGRVPAIGAGRNPRKVQDGVRDQRVRGGAGYAGVHRSSEEVA